MFIRALLLAGVTVGLMGCASSMRNPAPGLFYSQTQGPFNATSNQAGNRIGEACATSYLGLIGMGDSSIEAARRNGGITMITSVDEKYTNYFVFYGKTCTVVRGR